MALAMASRSIAYMIACRTRRSLNGFFVMFMLMVNELPGDTASITNFGSLDLIDGIQPGARAASIISTLLASKASVRAVVSMMYWNCRLGVVGRPAKYLSFPFRRT